MIGCRISERKTLRRCKISLVWSKTETGSWINEGLMCVLEPLLETDGTQIERMRMEDLERAW